MYNDHFTSLPLELQTRLTNDINVRQARLINKSTLEANKIKYCKSIKKITLDDIYDYGENYDYSFVLYTYDNHRNIVVNNAYIFNNGISNVKFTLEISVFGIDNRYYVEQINNVTFENVIKDTQQHNMVVNIDLLSTYNILKLKGCDKIIKHYSKNKVLLLLQHEQLELYSPNLDISDLHLWLLSNAIIMGLRENIYNNVIYMIKIVIKKI